MKEKLGRQHLFVVAACAGLAACALGLITNVNGIFFGPVGRALHAGQGAVSMAATLTAVFTGLMGPFSVKALQKYPLKRILAASVLATLLCTVGMAYSGNIWIYDIFSILRGISSSFIGIPVITLLMGNWFVEKRGLYTGIVMSCSGVVGAVLSPVLSSVIESFGYRTGYLLCAALMAVVCIPALAFLRLTPEEVGKEAYGKKHGKGRGQEKSNNFCTFKKVSVIYISLLVMAFLCQSVCSISQHLAGYAESVGQGSAVGAVMLSAAMTGNIIAKFAVGVLGDLLGAFKSAGVLVLAFLAGLVLLVSAPGHQWALYAGSFLLGTSYACALMLSNLTFAIYGTKQYGEAYSVLAVILNIGGALSITAVGYGYDLFQSYFVVLYTGAVLAIAALILLLLITKIRK